MAEAAAPIDAAAPAGLGVLSRGRRRYVLTLLMIAYTLSFLDRQVLSILVEPIKTELHASDSLMGLLTGPVFVIFYTFLGIPIAWLADRRSRPVIITISLTLWSGFTALSGMVTGFVPLALARLGVGFGEAGCNPASHSFIADISRPDQRASGLAFYSLGVPIGTLLGLAMGGLIADAYGWRAAFMVASAPGLALAALIALTVKETRAPAAGGTLARGFVQPFVDLADTVKALANKPTFWFAALGVGFSAFVGYAQLFFTASFFLRCHGPELAAIAGGFGLKSKGFLGPALGLVTGLGGMAGTLIGGRIADRAVTRDRRAFMSVPAIAAAGSIPFVFVIFTMKNTLGALVLDLIPNIVATIWYGAIYSTAQSVVAPHRRATAAALLFLILNLIGLGLGPTFLGASSDFFANTMHLGPAEGLRWALIVTGCFGLVAAVFFWLARSTVREDVVS
ncbi:MAG TPA: MFS transporter [Caulobacteraceae bacterium]|jgi:MFS family permease|nr:MFS transporter [Caulobacteraceae bacterium]